MNFLQPTQHIYIYIYIYIYTHSERINRYIFSLYELGFTRSMYKNIIRDIYNFILDLGSQNSQYKS